MATPDTTKWSVPAAGPGTDLNGTIDPANVVANVGGNLELWGNGNVGAQIIGITGQTYGAWEIRAMLPVGKGYGPDFGLYPTSGGLANGYIQIFKSLNGSADLAIHSLTLKTNTTKTLTHNTSITAAAFHLYRLEWTPLRVSWFVDGVKTYEITSTYSDAVNGATGADYIPTVPMVLRMFLNVGVTTRTDGSAPTLGIPVRDGSTPQPLKALVDYVHVYDYTPATSGSGTSNIPFDEVFVGTGATAIYDTTHTKLGTKALKIASGTTSTNTYMSYKTSLGTTVTNYGRCYYYFTARTPAHRIVAVQNATGACGGVFITATGLIQLGQYDGTILATSAAAIPLNQWVRIEWSFVCSATGSGQIRIYANADSATVTETLAVNSGNFRSSATIYTVGICTSVANVPAYWMDGVAWSDNGWLGAEGGGNNPPVVTIPATIKCIYGKRATLAVTAGYDPEGTAVAYTWAMTAAPTGANAFDSSQTLPSVTYTPNKVGNYGFTVTVTDATGLSTTALTTLVVKPFGWQKPPTGNTLIPLRIH